jgi:hypothetical protein
MLREAMISLIRDKCPPDWEPALFKRHILVHVPETEGNFLPYYRKVKKEITACVTEQFTVLEEEMLFEIRSGSWNCSFKLGNK